MQIFKRRVKNSKSKNNDGPLLSSPPRSKRYISVDFGQISKINSNQYNWVAWKMDPNHMIDTILIKLIEIYLRRAIPGIHRIETEIKNKIKNIAHPGHSRISVSPFSAIHAGYPLPFTQISKKLANKIKIMARGDKYFQQICQYKLGRLPIINSMSSENLESNIKL